MTDTVNMQDSMLLQIATTLHTQIPTVPDWYVGQYKDTHKIASITGEEKTNCNMAWETYYRTKLALNIMHSCASYELSQLKPMGNS